MLTFLVLTLTPALGAQNAQDKPKPCTAPEYRQFDFWLGEWDVLGVGGGRGVNRISSVYDGCVVREEYESGGGAYTGTSLNFYDASTSAWYQTWIDNQGQPLFLSGGIVDGKMVLSSEAGKRPVQRITWTPLDVGKVRQLWEQTDDGTTWSVVFDGTYTKRSSTAP